jgi:TPR repeat protein
MKGKKQYMEAKSILTTIYSSTDNALNEELYTKYLILLRKSAYLGFPEAQFDLGLQYGDSYIFGDNPNHKEAKYIFWCQKACSNGVADACNNLAAIYEGKGLFNEATLTYKKAIALGNKLAVKNLRTMRMKDK